MAASSAIDSHSQSQVMAGEAHDLGGRLVLPGLVDGHIHLDKGFIGDDWKPHRPCTAGFSVRERVTFEKEALADASSRSPYGPRP